VRSPQRFTHAGIVAATLLFTLLSSAGSAHASAPVAAPPGKVVVDFVNVNGSGCPGGTVAVSVTGDKTAFTLTYSRYKAQVGRGSSPLGFRKNCQFGLRVHVPQGFTYAVTQADYRGFASLAAGATALQKASYYFQGNSRTVTTTKNFAGPFAGNWQANGRVGLMWAPCGGLRDLNVNTELRVNAGTSNPATTASVISMNSTGQFSITWKRC
jgi:hypothetical protein